MLRFAVDLPGGVREYLRYEVAADALLDPRGRLVRFTPWRRTVMQTLPDGRRLFCKFRHRRQADARAEWLALQALAEIAVPVPRPLFFAQRGAASVIGMAEVPGRGMDAWFAEGRAPAAALTAMPALLRRLHDAGWVYRDMYWNHVFWADGLHLVDVERAFRPRWRRRRWIVKDLAGLLSSAPANGSSAAALRFLKSYLGDQAGDWRGLARQVISKAAQIRGHVTRYPG